MKQKARGGAASVFNLLVTATFTDEASETEFKVSGVKVIVEQV
jgi:hypothetical protein